MTTAFNLADAVTDITVSLTYGDTTVQVTGGRLEYEAGAPVAIGSLSLKWSRASARDHADPGDLTLTLLTRERAVPPVLRWGALVEVEATINGQPQQLIGRGWVDNLERSPVPGLTGWLWSLNVVDAIGRAAGHIVRAEPWPEEPAGLRYSRLNALGIVPIAYAGANWTVAPRDSNSQTLLALAHYACPPAEVVGEAPGGLAVVPSPSFGMGSWIEPGEVVQVPASDVEDTGVEINRAGTIIQADIRYRVYNPTEAEYQDATLYRRTDDPRDGGRFTLTTDVLLDAWNLGPELARWLEDIIAATATVRPRLRSTRLRPGPWLNAILPIAARTTAPIILLAGLPAWQDVDAAHHVTGGVLAVEPTEAGGATITLTVDLQPAPWDGWRRAILADFTPPAGESRVTLGTLEAGNSAGRRYTIADYTVYRRLGTS